MIKEINTNKREYSIDIIKIIAMFLVCLTHVIYMGTDFYHNDFGSASKKLVFYFLEAVALCCINLFSMASGYICCNRKVKYSNLLNLWIESIFVSILVCILFSIYKKDLSYLINSFPESVFIVSFNRYWYLCSYIILFIFMPFLNKLILKSKSKILFLLIIVLGFLLCLDSFFGQNSFYLGGGCSPIWLAYMYIVGGTIKKYKINNFIKKYFLFLLAFISLIFETIFIFFGSKILLNSGILSYNYIFITVASISLFILMINIKVNNKTLKRVLKTISSASFVVYIYHTNPVIFDNCIINRFTFVSDMSLPIAVIIVILSSSVIFIVGVLLGVFQKAIFKLFRINILCSSIIEHIKLIYLQIFNTFSEKLKNNYLKY